MMFVLSCKRSSSNKYRVLAYDTNCYHITYYDTDKDGYKHIISILKKCIKKHICFFYSFSYIISYYAYCMIMYDVTAVLGNSIPNCQVPMIQAQVSDYTWRFSTGFSTGTTNYTTACIK